MNMNDSHEYAPVIDPAFSGEGCRRLIRKISPPRTGKLEACGEWCRDVGLFGLIITFFISLFGKLSWWWPGGIGIFFATSLGMIGFSRARNWLRSVTPISPEEHEHYVGPHDLDMTCGLSLSRAQRAINYILDSDVYKDGLSDVRVSPPVLREHEWTVARDSRNLTQRRSDYTKDSKSPSGPMTAEVLISQRRALDQASNSIERKVSALEQYAETLRNADAMRHDLMRAQEVASRNEKYLDLVAQTAANERDTAEITAITEQDKRAFQYSLQQASLAAEVLILSDISPGLQSI